MFLHGLIGPWRRRRCCIHTQIGNLLPKDTMSYSRRMESWRAV